MNRPEIRKEIETFTQLVHKVSYSVQQSSHTNTQQSIGSHLTKSTAPFICIQLLNTSHKLLVVTRNRFTSLTSPRLYNSTSLCTQGGKKS